jgi:CheY-like chemotaxis protein
VLVVDDEEDLRVLLRLCLNRRGHHVIEAADGDEALALMSHVRPEAVLLDLRMPGRDGWTTLEAMRADPALRQLPVIVLSAYATTASRARATALGCVGYLTKPFRFDELERELDVLGPATAAG